MKKNEHLFYSLQRADDYLDYGEQKTEVIPGLAALKFYYFSTDFNCTGIKLIIWLHVCYILHIWPQPLYQQQPKLKVTTHPRVKPYLIDSNEAEIMKTSNINISLYSSVFDIQYVVTAELPNFEFGN